MHILLVEDEARVADFILRGLSAEGCSVAVASDAQCGLAKVLEQAPDVLVLDVNLPGRSGLELCRDLRRRDVMTPVLMLTAFDSTEDKIDGLRAGADDYMTKPFDFDELVARIEALYRRSKGFEPPSNKVLSCGELTLDPDTREVRRGTTSVSLTPTEFTLLEFLMGSKGAALSRTRILNRVWGYDAEPLTNVIEVYVRRLRHKLEMDPEAGPLRTVRGYGYKWVEHA